MTLKKDKRPKALCHRCERWVKINHIEETNTDHFAWHRARNGVTCDASRQPPTGSERK